MLSERSQPSPRDSTIGKPTRKFSINSSSLTALRMRRNRRFWSHALGQTRTRRWEICATRCCQKISHSKIYLRFYASSSHHKLQFSVNVQTSTTHVKAHRRMLRHGMGEWNVYQSIASLEITWSRFYLINSSPGWELDKFWIDFAKRTKRWRYKQLSISRPTRNVLSWKFMEIKTLPMNSTITMHSEAHQETAVNARGVDERVESEVDVAIQERRMKIGEVHQQKRVQSETNYSIIIKI